jgi:hypothetical protein
MNLSAALGQAGYRLLFDRVCINYTVHDAARIVFIQSVEPVLGHPLEDQA